MHPGPKEERRWPLSQRSLPFPPVTEGWGGPSQVSSGHPRLNLSCEEQTPGPVSRVWWGRPRPAQDLVTGVCGQGREVTRAQAETPPKAQGAVFSFPLFGQGTPPACTGIKCPMQSLDLPVLQQSRPGRPPPASCRPHPRLYSVTPCPSWGDPAKLPSPAGPKPAAPRPWRPPAQLAVPTPSPHLCSSDSRR